MRKSRSFAVIVLAICLAGEVRAGPPFVTDDPKPTDDGHWEIYNFAQGSRDSAALSGAAGLDINYGGYRDLQLTAVIPVAYEAGRQGGTGLGDIEIAAKYRFLHQDGEGWIPEVAFFPRVFVPTASRHFGTGHTRFILPLWAEKDFGKWSLFGGAGYNINPGPGQRNFWLGGVALMRAVSDTLSLGAEIYHSTPDAADARPFTGINLGLTYAMAEHLALLAAGGPGIQNARSGGRYDFYLALDVTF